MIKSIKEYSIKLEPGNIQHLYLPIDAQVVDIRKTDLGINLIVISEVCLENQLRSFQVCLPDSNISAKKVIYLGNYEDDFLGTLYVVEVIN